MRLDLTPKEQNNVRAALQFLRTRCGAWEPLAKLLGVRQSTLSEAARGKTVTPTIAFRVARFASVGVDELLAGKFPEPGTCPMCGHRKEDA